MLSRRRKAQTTTGISGRSGTIVPIGKLVRTCISFPDRAQGYAFDRFMGVSTKEPVLTRGTVFSADGENCPYSGAQWIPVRRALGGLSPGPSDVFVDLGSGKGKVLLIAGHLPYRRAIGVEIDEELSRHSERNVQRARSRLRTPLVEVVNASVLDWPLPDDASVIFMFNPFIGQTFRSAVGRVYESYDRRPRSLHIIYQFPWEHDWLLSTGRVSVVSVRPSGWPALPGWWRRGDVIVCYRVGAAAQNSAVPTRRGHLRRAAERWSRPNGHCFAMSAPDQDVVYSPPR